MKRMFLAAAAASIMAAPALADGFDNAVGNTVRIIVTEEGHGMDYYFDADGAASNSLGQSGATWTYGEELCLVLPAEAEQPDVCGPWNEDLAVDGDAWMTSAWSQNGNEISISILSGRGHDAPPPPPAPPEAE